jgi:hypothetical protein
MFFSKNENFFNNSNKVDFQELIKRAHLPLEGLKIRCAQFVPRNCSTPKIEEENAILSLNNDTEKAAEEEKFEEWHNEMCKKNQSLTLNSPKEDLDKAQTYFNKRYEDCDPNYTLCFTCGKYLSWIGYSNEVATYIMNNFLKLQKGYTLQGKYETNFDNGYYSNTDEETEIKKVAYDRPYTIEQVYEKTGLNDNSKIYFRNTGINKEKVTDKDLLDLWAVKSILSSDLVSREELLRNTKLDVINFEKDGEYVSVKASQLENSDYVVLDIDGDTELNRFFINRIQDLHQRIDKPFYYTVNPNTKKEISCHFIFKVDDKRLSRISGNKYDLLGNKKHQTSFEERRVTKTDKIIL